jgi:molybdopterin-guanine dinucleotide biosynthesis protein A
MIEEHLRVDDLRLIGFLREVRTRIVKAEEIDQFDPRHLSFFNANTPEDFELAQTLHGMNVSTLGFSE